MPHDPELNPQPYLACNRQLQRFIFKCEFSQDSETKRMPSLKQEIIEHFIEGKEVKTAI
jgi:hypothetical protein